MHIIAINLLDNLLLKSLYHFSLYSKYGLPDCTVPAFPYPAVLVSHVLHDTINNHFITPPLHVSYINQDARRQLYTVSTCDSYELCWTCENLGECLNTQISHAPVNNFLCNSPTFKGHCAVKKLKQIGEICFTNLSTNI